VEKISFGNKEYVKASDIAKKFRYTQDYVGQLCRGDKVDARLVGRVWYINPESVTEYRKTKHSTQKQSASASHPVAIKTTKSRVEPVVRPKTARNLPGTGLTRADNGSATVRTSYSSDAASVIPVLHNKGTSPKTLPTQTASEPVKSKPVIIKIRRHSKKPTHYVTEKTPETTLQSKLQVVESTDADVIPPLPKTADVATVRKEVVRVINHPAVIQVTAANRQTQELVSTPVELEETETVTKSQRHSKLLLFAVASITIAGCVLVLGLQSYTEVSEVSRQSGVTFEWATLLQKVTGILK
jgi:hypothetical protein